MQLGAALSPKGASGIQTTISLGPDLRGQTVHEIQGRNVVQSAVQTH